MRTDVSYDSLWCNATGFSWEQIEEYYAVQLKMLEQVHGMERDELKQKILSMYNNYYFDVDGKSPITLFNPYAINMLMATGEFEPYLLESGGTSILTTGAMSKDVLRQIVASDFGFCVETSKLESWYYDIAAKSLDKKQTCLLLHAAGFLTLSRESASGVLQRLVVPNDDIHMSLIDVVMEHAFSFNIGLARRHLMAGDFIDFLDVIGNRVVELAAAVGQRNRREQVHVLERDVQDAFLELLLILSKSRELFTFFTEPLVNEGGERKCSDILIRLERRAMVFEIGISDNAALHTTQLRTELAQMRKDGHWKVVGKRVAGVAVDAFAAIFTRDGALQCAAGPFRGKIVDGKLVAAELDTTIAGLDGGELDGTKIRGFRTW